MKTIGKICRTIVLCSLLCGCHSEEAYTEYERTSAEFLSWIGGQISELHSWRTAVALKVEVTTAAPVKLWLMSAEVNGVLYDYKEVNESGTVRMSVPQGRETSVCLLSVCDRQRQVQNIALTGKTEEAVTLNTTTQVAAEKAAPRRSAARLSADKAALYGNSLIGGGVYYELADEQLSDYYDIMEKMIAEGVNARTGMGLNCDYELESNGPFNITLIAGNCMSTTPHVMGYYYHTPGTYEDIRYVDITETEMYDYIDGLAKVQYQVNNRAAELYGVEADKWYDANFDMKDRWDNRSSVKGRQDDDSYNAMAVYERYGRDIKALRGISFRVDVPKGMHLGFYDRWEEQYRPDQYDRLVRYGVTPYTTRERFRGTSYSAEGMNVYNSEGNFRSFIEQRENMTWMGLENDITGGDLDCNDVIFGVTVEMEVFRPTVVEPGLMPKGEYNDLLPWTIAYEDIARGSDFDFNDAVIKVVPDYEKEQCCVTVMAAGSDAKMYLHYDGPDGDRNLGELHELLGGKPGQKINTTTSVAAVPFVEVGCVRWPKEYTMQTDARRFYIEIQRGSCTDCTDQITLADVPGAVPQALLIAGEWQWPKEGTRIVDAYSIFSSWAIDTTKLNYWKWYASPKSGSCVDY